MVGMTVLFLVVEEEQATARANADPYGMTNKRQTKDKQKTNKRQTKDKQRQTKEQATVLFEAVRGSRSRFFD
jgi:hypothetical protein